MIKRYKRILIILLIILSISFNTNATENKNILTIVEKESKTEYLENNQGYISKTIVDSNSDTGEVTIELKLSNTKKEGEKTINTEIFLVVDNSPSMDFVTSTGKTRKELILNSATQLVTSIFNSSNNVKIGLIDFHGVNGGIFGESASIYNATVRQKLTDNKETVLSAIQAQLQRKTIGGTNIDAGLQRAEQNFSKTDNNKVIILLTDGIPNADVKGTKVEDGNDVTDKGNIEIGVNTKNTLLKIKNSGIYTITLLTGMSESDGNTDKDGNEYEDKNTLEEKLKAAEDIFGTSTKPTADKYYLVSNVDINKIITEDILKDVTSKIQNPISNTKIVDYFPEDITENFEFSYVENPTIGTTSDDIDPDSKTITWDIGTLKGNEIATLKYKLKLKDMNNTKLLDKVISTNEKVVLTYTDNESKEYEVTLDSSPKVKLTKSEDDKKNNIIGSTDKENTSKEDNTISKNILPNTGKIILMWSIAIIAVSGIVAHIRYKKLYIK